MLQTASSSAMRIPSLLCAAVASARNGAPATSILGLRLARSRSFTSDGLRQFRLIEAAPRLIAPSEKDK